MASRFLDLYCKACDIHVMRYRKEGSGDLIRAYLDRIQLPADLAQYKQSRHKSDFPALKCPQCEVLIGAPMIHNDGRPAYRMIKGTYKKKGS